MQNHRHRFVTLFPPRRFTFPWLALALLGATPVFGQLLLDFNSTTQDGGPHPQAGYASYDAGHEVAEDFVTRSYSAFGTTVEVTPAWPSTTDNRVQQMIDRSAAADANWQGYQVDLITDWIGADTRTGSGGLGNWDRATNGAPTYLTLTLSGLPADTYQWTSYHHDNEKMWSDFQVEVSTDGGATYGAAVDMEGTASNAGGTPPAPILYNGVPDPFPRSLPSTFVTTFTADGVNDVVVRFALFVDGVDPIGVHKQFLAINALEVVNDAPVIAFQPQGQDVVLGERVQLDTDPTSLLPMSLQWRRDGTPIPGATNATYEIAAATAADAGTYDLVATTAVGSVTSDTAAVTIGLPAIAPPSQVVLATFPATFSITMPTNSTGYTYAWSGPAGPIVGATNASLTVTGVTVADGGSYSVEVTLAGSALSTSATLIVPNPPSASYPDTILADGPVGYWRLGEPSAAGAALDAVSPFYDLVVGTSTLLEQPGVVLGDTDTAAGFDGSDESPLNGLAFENDLNPSLFSVEFWARPTGGSGRRTAVGARDLVVLDESWIEGYEVGLNGNGEWEFRTGQGDVGAGNNAWNTLTGPAAAIGSWSQVVATYDGATMALYVNGVAVATLPVGTYTPQPSWPIRVGGGANEQTGGDVFVGDLDEVAIYASALAASDVLDHFAASTDVTAPPIVSTHPELQAVLIGTQAVFQVSVISGTNPSYQWRRGGVDIPGETGPTLVIDPVELSSAGEFEVVVSNTAGSTTSDAAFLVPLADYIGTLVIPDGTNTVLTRNGLNDWFAVEDGSAANAAGKWNQRDNFKILPDVTPWGFEGNSSGENNGDLKLRTTITGLAPNTAYAVWSFFSDKPTEQLSSMLSALDGEPLRLFTKFDAIETDLRSNAGNPWPVYHCFLGLRTSDANGAIAVLVDYADGFNRTVYHGVGYQLAVPAAAPPVISIPPSSQAVLIGSNATFEVAASSVVPLTYQWQMNGADLAGETNATLTVAPVARADAGKYRVRVTNSEGTVTSDEVDLVALENYIGTFVYPDASNTVLTRDNSSVWQADNQADAESNGWWWARAEFGVPGVPDATNGFFATGVQEGAGDVELRTTVTGLTPGESYAFWVLYSQRPGGSADRMAAGFAGDAPATFGGPLNIGDIGVTNGPTANWAVYYGFLGVKTVTASGELDVVIDYRGLSNAVYNGLGYQLAVLPPDVLLNIELVGGGLQLSWPDGGGVLQGSEDLTNPAAWTDVPGATESPYADPGTAPAKAFRLRE